MRWLALALLCSCGDEAAPRDLATADLAVGDLAVGDFAALDFAGGDLATSDGSSSDGGGCLAQVGPTHLYEGPCLSGGTICFFDHPPSGFF